MEGRPLRGIAETPPTQCVPRDACQVLWQFLQLTQEQGGLCAGQAWKSCGLSVTMQPMGMFSSLFTLPRWARLGGLCSGVGPRSWGHSAWGGGCGRELSHRGGGLPPGLGREPGGRASNPRGPGASILHSEAGQPLLRHCWGSFLP